MSNPKKQQKGAIAIIAAILLLILIAFLGLAVDSGYMFVKKNELQNVADSVALACLIKDRETACGTAASPPTSASDVTSNSDITPILTPVIPPGIQTDYVVLATYPYTPCPSSATQCAKASASTQFTPFFMHIFGFSNLPISASAVAANTAGVDCLVVQDLLNQNGTPQLYGKNCDVRMGQAHDVGTTQITAAHNYIYNGNPPSDCSDCSPPAISKPGAVPVPSLIPIPSWEAEAPLRTDPVCKNATCNLLPGRYPLGIDCSGAKADCIFATGKYYLDGPLYLDSNNGQSSGTQVFFYMRGNGSNGDITVNAGGVSILTGWGTSTGNCPTTNYQLLFYAPDGNSGQTFSLRGNTGSSIVGNIYLKDYFLDWRGTNAMAVDGTIVVNKFHQNGNNTLTIDPTKISCHFAGGGKISLIE